MQFVLSIGALLFAGASLFGWGELVRRIARMAPSSWPITIGLGLSTVLAIGGVVNLARISFAVTLWIVATTGFLLFVLAIRQACHPVRTCSVLLWTSRTRSERIETVAASAFIAVIIFVIVATQLPPAAFNFHDDLQKYFAHPVRQLSTGTLFGSPLSALGSETLGGMAFLHSFVVSILPIQFINGVDAAFGLALLMTLGAAAGWRRMSPLPGALLAPILIVCIEPQYVNVSALYLGSSLMAVAVLQTVGEQETRTDEPSALSLGLIYSGMVALKPTFALFPALHLPLAAIAFSITDGSARRGLKWGARVVLWTAVTLAPWIFLHMPHYLNAAASQAEVVPDGPSEDVNLFSIARLFYGATMASYSALIGLALLTILWGLVGLWQSSSNSDRRRLTNLIIAALTVTIIYGILLFEVSPILGGIDTSVRYSIPFLVGIIPIVIVLSASKFPAWPNVVSIGIPVLALVAVAIAFMPSMLERYRQAIEYRSILAFSDLARAPAYLEYNRRALSATSAQEIQKMQRLIPENEPFLAWINQPYHLDFHRNPVVDIEPAGLATPWARIPPTVRYIIWEYKGFGVRSAQDYQERARSVGLHERLIAVRALRFAQQLNATVQRGSILYVDEEFVVARLAAP